MLKITDENYQKYKSVFETIWIYLAHLTAIDPNVDYSPVAMLNASEKQSKSLAKRGLKETLMDMFSMISDLPTTSKAELHRELIAKGLPGLYELIGTIKDVQRKVINRGKIKNIDEYYVIKELLIDLNSDLSTEDSNRLELILSDFEIRYAKRKNIS